VSSILAQRFLKSLRSFAARVSFILAQFGSAAALIKGLHEAMEVA
jgi:hypothetical protein